MANVNNNLPYVLVVDDVAINRMVIGEILKNKYNVLTAENGIKALEILRTCDVMPKIVLLDIIMPEMDGYQLLDAMKKDAVLEKIPVIFITTSDSEVDALSSGAVDFISKPFRPEIVNLRVANQIRLKNYSDNLEQMVEAKTAELLSTLNKTLEAMANIIEYRNLESGSHVKRTTVLSEALVNYLLDKSKYSDELKTIEPEVVVKATALHDVGKIGIPDAVLLKPSRLTPEEFEIIKTHTTIGKDIIDSIIQQKQSTYFMHCRDICYYHHERFDGNGYPCGIKGIDIPLSARILSIVDVYDALRCRRIYKNPMSHEEVLSTIKDGYGTQFDPVITDALFEIQADFNNLFVQYQ